MSQININSQKVMRRLGEAKRDQADSLEKLSSGQVFTQRSPRPADRALAQGLELKLRGLAASKRNINDAISLLQTADSGFSEITNILVRMKEINIAGATTIIDDKERKYLFVEYQALYDELDRVSKTTEFNGIPLLNGSDQRTPETLVLRIADPVRLQDDNRDLNEIQIENLRDIVATPSGLGLKSAKDYITDDASFEADDASEFLEAREGSFSNIYDEALSHINDFRASYGAVQSRLQSAINYNDVMEENIAAAKSRIADTDYAKEVANLTQSNILMQANTALLGQANFTSALSTSLVGQLA